jgi:long-subunit fatty acid transport protein
MSIKKFSGGLLVAVIAQLTIASQSFAAGFEKSIMWGAHEAGVAGIATPWVTGADALYYNPAGLVKDKPGNDVSLQMSPTWSKFNGPINYSGDVTTGTQTLVMPSALIYDRTIDENFGFGVGAYVSGGAKAQFDNVPFTGTQAQTANVYTNIQVTEFAAGAGYKLNDKFKVGVAWRVVMANVGFGLVQPVQPPTAPLASQLGTFANIQVSDAKMSNFTGFKLGTQYKLSDRTLLGATFRSEVALKGDGTFGGTVSGAGAAPIANSTATINSTFPMQISIGAQHDYEKWRALAEYVWSQYSRIGEIAIDGTAATSGGTVVASNPRVQTHWQDEHALRLGGEYLGYEWPIRFGYVGSTAVTDPAYAKAGFAPPGMTHTLTVGSGKGITVMNNPLNLDGAIEYTMASGSGTGAGAGAAYETGTTNYTRSGTYSANAYVLHLGASYAF